ncbi:transposase [Chryseomicrobium aureum]|uniref:transposase n=1 Tax=Chryseomicrobium aureum TaxID=1441723 RepID=UPI00370D252F
MPRKKRAFQPNHFYHCIMRGNNRHNVYPTDLDMLELTRSFELAHERYPFQIVAYCFMSNHYHILIREEHGNLSKIMALVNKRYSDHYRKRYDFIGRIYQQRFWAFAVRTPRKVLETSAYIHRNPIQTQVPMVENLKDYPHSSFPHYVSSEKKPPTFLDLTYLPNLLYYPFEKTTTSYVVFVLHRSFFAIENGVELEEYDSRQLLPFVSLEKK